LQSIKFLFHCTYYTRDRVCKERKYREKFNGNAWNSSGTVCIKAFLRGTYGNNPEKNRKSRKWKWFSL